MPKLNVFTSASPSQGPPRPLTPEELADRTVPSDPRISPDGSRVVFVASPASKSGETWMRSLWMAGDGLPARQFTGGAADDIDPRWSPDGSHILFLSRSEERRVG